MQPNIEAAAAMKVDNKMALAIKGKMPSQTNDFIQRITQKGVVLHQVKGIPRDSRHR